VTRSAVNGGAHTARVLVTAASKAGATAEIARAIAGVLGERGLDVSLTPPEQVSTISDFDAVVLGSAVYRGHWLMPARRLVQETRDALTERPVWLFSSGPIGDPARKLVQRMGEDLLEISELVELARAREHRMFPGKLEKDKLSFRQRAALFPYRGLEGDFRDWSEIQAWASQIADALLPADGSACGPAT
jgi:menaquinone-dependent protoporphyrinogen oxidase